MSETIRRLPDSELAVMQAVWAFEPPVARSQIETLLPGDMALTTLLTLLSRLQEKGFLRIEKAGRRSLYIPLVAQKDYQAAQSRRFVDQVFGGSIPAFAAALCDQGLSREELEELRRLLREDAL